MLQLISPFQTPISVDVSYPKTRSKFPELNNGNQYPILVKYKRFYCWKQRKWLIGLPVTYTFIVKQKITLPSPILCPNTRIRFSDIQSEDHIENEVDYIPKSKTEMKWKHWTAPLTILHQWPITYSVNTKQRAIYIYIYYCTTKRYRHIVPPTTANPQIP